MTQSFPGSLVPQTSPSLLFAWGSVLALNKNGFLFNSPMKEADPPPPPAPTPTLTLIWQLLVTGTCTVFLMTFTVMTDKTHLYRVVLRWKGKTVVYKWKGCSTPWCFTWLASRRIQVWDVCLPAFLFPQLCCGQRCLSEWLPWAANDKRYSHSPHRILVMVRVSHLYFSPSHHIRKGFCVLKRWVRKTIYLYIIIIWGTGREVAKVLFLCAERKGTIFNLIFKQTMQILWIELKAEKKAAAFGVARLFSVCLCQPSDAGLVLCVVCMPAL